MIYAVKLNLYDYRIEQVGEKIVLVTPSLDEAKAFIEKHSVDKYTEYKLPHTDEHVAVCPMSIASLPTTEEEGVASMWWLPKPKPQRNTQRNETLTYSPFESLKKGEE